MTKKKRAQYLELMTDRQREDAEFVVLMRELRQTNRPAYAELVADMRRQVAENEK